MSRAPRLHPSSPISTLTLTINKGPKAGETLNCNPKALTRIGRVVNGSTLAIKDPAISQKHLTITFLPEIHRWVLTDLGSSNGTHINGSLISPDQPSPLSDGDLIKIGENTSISVSISSPVSQTFEIPRCDRPSRPPNVKFGDKELDEGEASKMGVRGRKGGRSSRISTKKKVSESVLMERRFTRSSARGLVNESKEEDVSIISDSEFVDVMERKKQSKESNAGTEEEVLGLDGEKNTRVEEEEDDLDNMTLEDWFDRMEEYLPRSINKVAEEIIDKLRKKAQFFDEYISQISNGT